MAELRRGALSKIWGVKGAWDCIWDGSLMTVGPVQNEGLGIMKYSAAVQITSRTVIDIVFEATMVRGGLE